MNIFMILIPIGICVSYINYLFTKSINPGITDILKISIYVLPIQFLVAVCFAIYYAYGIKEYSYLTLTITSIASTLIFGSLIMQIFFKDHIFTSFEVSGIVLVLSGVVMIVVGKSYAGGIH